MGKEKEIDWDSLKLPDSCFKKGFAEINNIVELSALGDLLRNQKVFGFDVEYQHYKKIICSIQIATFTSDFLIDTMCFNRTKIENTLKAAFEDPTILKVAHASSNDCKWLLECANIRVKNLFDTQEARRQFGKTLGLKETVKDLCDFNLDKSLQRNDWSKRPLSTRMKDYLRLDVHFLLPCYELLNEQLSKQGIKIEKAFVRYKYPPLTHSGRMHLLIQKYINTGRMPQGITESEEAGLKKIAKRFLPESNPPRFGNPHLNNTTLNQPSSSHTTGPIRTFYSHRYRTHSNSNHFRHRD